MFRVVTSGSIRSSQGPATGIQRQSRRRLTIDRALQQAAVDQLKGKHGAVVVLNPQNGDVLALYSEPSYSLTEVDDEATWIRLEANERDKPLVSRALGAYYIPGSTFKTVTMTAAFLAGEQDTEFTCSGGGYAAPERTLSSTMLDQPKCMAASRSIMRLKFPATSTLPRWVTWSRTIETRGAVVGHRCLRYPSEALRGRKRPDIWNASTEAVKRALAPREATIVTGKQVTLRSRAHGVRTGFCGTDDAASDGDGRGSYRQHRR